MKKISSIIEILFSIIVLLLLTNNQINAQENIRDEVDSHLKNLPFESFDIQLPSFNDKTFNIKDYGAVGDGHTMNTDAFKITIEACSKAGGGQVVVPPGLWLTGPIELQSNIDFHVERGALILFSPNHNDYPIIKRPTGGYVVAPPIYGFNLENIAITGSGLIDGNGTTWRPLKRSKVNESLWRKFVNSGGVTNSDNSIWYPSKAARDGREEFGKLRKSKKEITTEDLLPFRDAMRPRLVLLINCNKIYISDITLENAPTFALNPIYCEDLVIRNIKVNNEYWAQNGDAVDIGMSKNVLVYGCTITAGDDGICMKSGHSRNPNEPALQNVVITNCVVYHAHGGFVTGSETYGGMHNIYVNNCDFVGTDVGLRFKSGRNRGGLVDNIFIKNIFMKDIVREAVLFNTYYENSKDNEKAEVNNRTPIFKNIFIDSIFCDGARQAVLADGLPEMPIQDIKISNSYISADKGFESKYAEGFTLNNVEILTKSAPVFNLDESSDFTLNKIIYSKDITDFLTVSGKDSKSISIENTHIPNSDNQIKFMDGLDRSIVIVK
jgi:polygalacturonase